MEPRGLQGGRGGVGARRRRTVVVMMDSSSMNGCGSRNGDLEDYLFWGGKFSEGERGIGRGGCGGTRESSRLTIKSRRVVMAECSAHFLRES